MKKEKEMIRTIVGLATQILFINWKGFDGRRGDSLNKFVPHLCFSFGFWWPRDNFKTFEILLRQIKLTNTWEFTVYFAEHISLQSRWAVVWGFPTEFETVINLLGWLWLLQSPWKTTEEATVLISVLWRSWIMLRFCSAIWHLDGFWLSFLCSTFSQYGSWTSQCAQNYSPGNPQVL